MKNKILIIGCGKIAAVHAKNLKALNADLTFYSREWNRSNDFAQRFGAKSCSGTLAEALDSVKPDAAWICTPPRQHLTALHLCLERELKVFCEKPLVVSSSELSELSQSPLSESLIMVGENYLYRPMLKWLTTVRESYSLGAVQEVSVRKESYQKVSDWRQNESALIEGGIHFVALILDVLNYPKFANIEIQSTDNQKAFAVNAQTLQGAKVKLDYSWTNRWSLPAGLLQSSRIRFERGEVSFESNGLYATLRSDNGSIIERRGFVSDLGGFSAMTQDALQWINGKVHAPKSTFAKAVSALNFVGVG